MKQKGKKIQKGTLLGFEPRTLGTITTRLIRSAICIYIEYFCASLMNIMNDIDVILKGTATLMITMFNMKDLNKP